MSTVGLRISSLTRLILPKVKQLLNLTILFSGCRQSEIIKFHVPILVVLILDFLSSHLTRLGLRVIPVVYFPVFDLLLSTLCAIFLFLVISLEGVSEVQGIFDRFHWHVRYAIVQVF